MANIKITDLFDLNETISADYLKGFEYPWEALASISEYIVKLGNTLDLNEFNKIGDDVWIHKSAKVYPSACLNGPLIVCKDAEIRHCAFIRGSAIVGEGAVVGNSTELKNVILFNKVQVPHYNYVGDSILGFKAHMGAGSITSNVKSDKLNVVIKGDGVEIPTNRKKVGAMLGDNVEVGCNSVLNPGTILCKGASVYPCSCVRGVIKENGIYKKAGEVVIRN
ncbi:MAG: UDP-N-acetylglucosamine pyrophosphorylase [Lachnospiraceae bacterium]|nr:UDP-N-acetylglucosamine pyrophosphorylase [Lachnospiraceae bacterium]